MPKSALALLGLACLIQIASGEPGPAPHGNIVCASAKICSSTDDRCISTENGGFGIVPRDQANEWVIRRDEDNKYNFQVKDHSSTSYLGIYGNSNTEGCSNNMFTNDRNQSDHHTQGFEIEPYFQSITNGYRTSPITGGCQIKWNSEPSGAQVYLSSKICGQNMRCGGDNPVNMMEDGGGSCVEHDPRADDQWVFHGCTITDADLTSCFQPTGAVGGGSGSGSGGGATPDWPPPDWHRWEEYPQGSCGDHKWGSNQDGRIKCSDPEHPGYSPYREHSGQLHAQGDGVLECCMRTASCESMYQNYKTSCSCSATPITGNPAGAWADPNAGACEEIKTDYRAESCCSSHAPFVPPEAQAAGAARTRSVKWIDPPDFMPTDWCPFKPGPSSKWTEYGLMPALVELGYGTSCNQMTTAGMTPLTVRAECQLKQCKAVKENKDLGLSGAVNKVIGDQPYHTFERCTDNVQAVPSSWVQPQQAAQPAAGGETYPADSCGDHQWGAHQDAFKCTTYGYPAYPEHSGQLHAPGNSAPECCAKPQDLCNPIDLTSIDLDERTEFMNDNTLEGKLRTQMVWAAGATVASASNIEVWGAQLGRAARTCAQYADFLGYVHDYGAIRHAREECCAEVHPRCALEQAPDTVAPCCPKPDANCQCNKYMTDHGLCPGDGYNDMVNTTHYHDSVRVEGGCWNTNEIGTHAGDILSGATKLNISTCNYPFIPMDQDVTSLAARRSEGGFQEGYSEDSANPNPNPSTDKGMYAYSVPEFGMAWFTELPQDMGGGNYALPMRHVVIDLNLQPQPTSNDTCADVLAFAWENDFPNTTFIPATNCTFHLIPADGTRDQRLPDNNDMFDSCRHACPSTATERGFDSVKGEGDWYPPGYQSDRWTGTCMLPYTGGADPAGSVDPAAAAGECHGISWDSAKTGCACPGTPEEAGDMPECFGAAAAAGECHGISWDSAKTGCACPGTPEEAGDMPECFVA